MLFNSFIFLLAFLPLTWVCFRIAGRYGSAGSGIGVLVACSLVFYSYWNPPFVILIIASFCLNFLAGRCILTFAQYKKPILAIGITVDICLLGYFKYAGFLVTNLNTLCGLDMTVPSIFLPLGISFFSFQQIAYLVDTYKGLTRRSRFLDYALFVTLFPHLIAGPIVRYNEIMPNIEELRSSYRPDYPRIIAGLALISVGLFKKVIIADSMIPWVKPVFDGTAAPTLLEAWGAGLSYTFQIYFDFSGYTDIAIGLAKLFNIDFPVNFNSPYKASSIIDFWRRWHITLSRFFKDYVYIALGGSRNGNLRQYWNIMATMLLCGAWHGASWSFVLWGGMHGVFLCLNHMWRKLANRLGVVTPTVVGWFVTFLLVVSLWVIFRAPSLDRAIEIWRGMIGLNGVLIPEQTPIIPLFRSLLEPMGVVFGKFVSGSSWSFWGGKEICILAVLFLFCVLLPNSAEVFCSGRRGPSLATCIGALLLGSPLLLASVYGFDPAAISSIVVGGAFFLVIVPGSLSLVSLWFMRGRGLSAAREAGQAVAVGVIFFCAVFGMNRVSEFLYFQF